MPSNWKIGDRIENRWEVHRIFPGGMGVVYVLHSSEGSVYAAKTFRDEILLSSSRLAKAFKIESLAWVKLDAHPNLVEAKFFKVLEGRPLLFLEFVTGGDLSQWIGTPRLGNLTQILKLAMQFCDGMTHAAEKGIKIHQDIKPQNCLMTEHGVLKITDFGLARVLGQVAETARQNTTDQSNDFRLSRTGTIVGTCTHMAPEQFGGSTDVGTQADVYAFGIMLFQMATGRLPFYGRSWSEFERAHRHKPPPRLSGVAESLNDIVQRCLLKNPGRRYPDFKALRADLEMIYENFTRRKPPEPLQGKALDSEGYNSKGVSLSALGQIEEAIECYDRAIESDRSNGRTWANKAVALAKLGRYPEALECADHAINLNPRSATALSNKADCLLKLGRTAEAISNLDQAIALDGNYENGWYNKGALLLKQLRMAEAIQCFDHVLAINPRNHHAWHNKAKALSVLSRSNDALLCYENAIGIDGAVIETWVEKGVLHDSIGDHREAIACYERAINIDLPSLMLYHRASSNDPSLYDEAVVRYYRGCAFGNLGRFREAVQDFERAAGLGHPLAREAIAKCLESF